MISFTVRMRFDQTDLERMHAHLVALTQASRREPGCVNYIAHSLQDDPCVIVIYEQYENEAALEDHRNTSHFKEHALEGLYREMRSRSVESLFALA